MRVFMTARPLPKGMTGHVVLLLTLLLLGLPTVSFSVNFVGCRNCHQEGLDQDAIRLNQHEPFAQKQCAACHAKNAPASGLKSGIVATTPASKRSRAPKVTWLAESSQLSAEHSFVIPGDKLGGELVVDLRGERNRYPRQKISLPLLKELEEVPKSGVEPEITMIRVLEVKRGVFLSVLISWQTDLLTDAQVLYGVEDLSQRSEKSQRFGRSHQVRLYNLKPDEQYQFQVVGTDLFGRSKVSEIHTFSTEKPFAMEPSATGSSQIALKSNLQRLGNSYLVQLQMDKPAAVFVGSVGEVRVQKKKPRPNIDKLHDRLSSGLDLNIAACLNCHRGQEQRTHPVNVLAKPGMTIPPDYPTLPDGRITCGSCHNTHSSDNDYLTIRRGKRELCVGCHKDML